MRIGNLARNLKLFFYTIFPLTIFFISCNTSENSEVFTFNGSTMGTSYSVKIFCPSNLMNEDKIKIKIDSLLLDINQKMSTYIPNSELSLINSSTDTSWISVSEELIRIIDDAIKIGKETEPYYNITIGPVVNLWGFGPEASLTRIPSDNEIENSKLKTGIDKIELDYSLSKLKKKNKDLYIDLSSIAKGYGVDKVGMMLEDDDFNNYMVEIGGEVRTRGTKDNGENWRIGISTPVGNGLQKILSISGVSVATSGDYLNYFEKDGVRYSHLIDPSTCKPISHNLASVTVIDTNCKISDAYATAINVMGPEIGYKFALEKKLPVFMIVREENSFIEKMTPQFEEYIYKGN